MSNSRSRSRSILFFTPDYHCSFFLKDELIKRGWTVEISVGSAYPKRFLFRNDVRQSPFTFLVLDYAWRWVNAIRFKYVIHYGRLSAAGMRFSKLLDIGLRLWCRVLRMFGTRIIYVPSGCRDRVSKSQWQEIDRGNVCGNCGFEPRCLDVENTRNFNQVRKIAAAAIAGDGHPTQEFAETRIRYKSLDLDLFHPNISIPSEFRWVRSANIRILHSHALETRNLNGKNLKGTPHVIQVVDRLKSEELDVDLVNLSGIRSNEMRFHQVQADIVIDQLIYGGVGSTALECLALGKPVICYIRPSWREFLASIFPEWSDCPIVSATPETLYLELKKLIVDEIYRHRVAKESREFALKFLDAKKNVRELENLLLSIK